MRVSILTLCSDQSTGRYVAIAMPVDKNEGEAVIVEAHTSEGEAIAALVDRFMGLGMEMTICRIEREDAWRDRNGTKV
jgi:hypothetical protein